MARYSQKYQLEFFVLFQSFRLKKYVHCLKARVYLDNSWYENMVLCRNERVFHSYAERLTQVFTDTWKIYRDVDSKTREASFIAYTRELQKLWRLEGT